MTKITAVRVAAALAALMAMLYAVGAPYIGGG
jgi:hypothetical protein